MIFRGITLLSALLPTAGLLFVPALVAAAPTDLFISEYVEGTSNNKAIEIYNGTGTGIDTVAGNYNVQMFFNGDSSAGPTINLLGTIASDETFVLAHALAEPAVLARAQQTNASAETAVPAADPRWRRRFQ